MNLDTTGHRHHPLVIGTHWLTLALLVAVVALIELRGAFPKGSDGRELMKAWHFTLGMALWGLVFARLALRGILRAPPLQPGPPAWQQAIATAMHVALYAFLLVMPLLGWLALSAKGATVHFFGLELPTLIGPNRGLASSLEDVHEAIGSAGYFLVGAHAAAGLFHHYVLRDDTLRRMSPWPDRAPAPAGLRRPR
ncbi:MAG: cytochrome b [Ideonella sp.]|nr:cytochrome b [Ideonella sp.]MCC7459246.1 cytochrome b [Nitrospira sp.]